MHLKEHPLKVPKNVESHKMAIPWAFVAGGPHRQKTCRRFSVLGFHCKVALEETVLIPNLA
jgi:hypothetical protein